MYLANVFFVSQIFNLPKWFVAQEMLNLIFTEKISPEIFWKNTFILFIIKGKFQGSY